MEDLAVAGGLVLVIEGALWCLFPDAMRRAAARAAELDPAGLRWAGLTAAALGVGLVWLVRR
jgi:uncharacterized protein